MPLHLLHYSDVIMGTMASQITSLTIVYTSVCSGADQRKHQSSTSLAFVRGIHRSPVNPPHKRPVTRKLFSFDDVIMLFFYTFDRLLLSSVSLQRRHNRWNGVSNHQPPDCLLYRLFKAQIKETSKLRVTDFCEGDSAVTGEFPSQRASNTENVSIW